MEIKNFKQQYNRFSSTMLAKIVEKNTVAFSPFSAIIMLAIVAMASKGKTQEEIIRYIVGASNFEDFIHVIKSLNDRITSSDVIVSSNAVYVTKEIEETIIEKFSDKIKEQFNGELLISSEMVKDINDWVNRCTRGMISEIVDDSMSNMRSCFLNAIYFEDEWNFEYEKYDIERDWFKNIEGKKQRVSMMSSEENIYLENEYFTGFSKHYKNGLSYVGLLPKKEGDIDYLKTAIENTDITKLLLNPAGQDVYVRIPEHKISYEKNLSALLEVLGIKKIFTPEADLGNLSTEWLMVDSIRQKVKIIVDRKGTKAAAVTCVGIMGAGFIPTPTVDLNRPFVFAIVHDDTKLPIFTGVVNSI